jgi:ankyrin repeat protein
MRRKADFEKKIQRHLPSWPAEGVVTCASVSINPGASVSINLPEAVVHQNASVNQANNIEETPLHIASREGRGDVVQHLLDQDENVNQADNYGQTPLYIASGRGHEAVVRLLLDKNANVNQAAHYGRTPLDIARQKGHEAVVQLLLGQNAIVT